jgi:hypothetical protein
VAAPTTVDQRLRFACSQVGQAPSAVCSQIGRIESGVAVPFEHATDLIDGGVDFGRIVPTPGNVPSAEDISGSLIDRAGRPREDSELNGKLARDRDESYPVGRT